MTVAINAQVSAGGKEPSLLLIHELGATHRAFRWLAPYLKDRRTIAIDLPGCGVTPALAEGSTLIDYADTLADWLGREVKRPVIVLGIAFGAALGTIMAVRRPEAIAGIVYCCMGPVIEPHTTRFLEDRCIRVLREGMGPTVEASLNVSFPASVRGNGREQVFEEYRRDLSNARVDGYVNQSRALARSGTTIGDHLRKAEVPVTIVAGSHDGHFNADIMRQIGALAPRLQGTVMIDDAAHLPHVQAPARLAEVVHDFASRIPGGAA
jgi:pimeloyl-ACP methyl ester carboxylesterase